MVAVCLVVHHLVDDVVHLVFQLGRWCHNHVPILDSGAEAADVGVALVSDAQLLHDVLHLLRLEAVFFDQRVQTADFAVMYPRQAEILRRLADEDVGGVLGGNDLQRVLGTPG